MATRSNGLVSRFEKMHFLRREAKAPPWFSNQPPPAQQQLAHGSRLGSSAQAAGRNAPTTAPCASVLACMRGHSRLTLL